MNTRRQRSKDETDENKQGTVKSLLKRQGNKQDVKKFGKRHGHLQINADRDRDTDTDTVQWDSDRQIGRQTDV